MTEFDQGKLAYINDYLSTNPFDKNTQRYKFLQWEEGFEIGKSIVSEMYRDSLRTLAL